MERHGRFRVALEGLRLLIRQELRALLAEERPPSTAGSDTYVGTEEAARILDVEQASVRAWVKSGRLTARKLDGVRGWKIRRSDLGRRSSRARAGGQPAVLPPTNLAAERAKRIAATIQRKPGDG